MTDLENQVSYRNLLGYVGRYRLMLVESLAALLLRDGPPPVAKDWGVARSSAGVKLQRLCSDGFLNHHRKGSAELPPLIGNVPYFTLTPKGAREAGCKPDRAEQPGTRPLKEAALAVHLTALWWCTLSGVEAHRVEPVELAPLFGKHKSFENVPHAIAREGERLRVYRLYSPASDPSEVLKHVRKQLAEAMDKPELGPWLPEGDYAFAILLPEPRYCRDMNDAIDASGLREQATFRISYAPTPSTLASALIEIKRGDPGDENRS